MIEPLVRGETKIYLSSIRLKNFRVFSDATIEFNEGLNVLIGENNAGKSTVIRALSLIFDRSSRPSLTVHDFHRGISPSINPPEIILTATIRSSPNGRDKVGDRAVVASWLTKLDDPWEAQLSFVYSLPPDEAEAFRDRMRPIIGSENAREQFWECLEKFLPKYTSRIYGGNLESRNRAESEWLEKFDFQYLDAFRDVESRMFSGRSAALRDVLFEFLDHNVDPEERATREADFRRVARDLIERLRDRIDLYDVLRLATRIGATAGGEPRLDGNIGERDLLRALNLVIRGDFDLPLPITQSGLGYNNLIYMSLVLANLRKESSLSYAGAENVKVFPILLIEEPEAHLHPPLQYKFLRFLHEELDTNGVKTDMGGTNNNNSVASARQVFVTTHSTHITAAVSLDSIICLVKGNRGHVNVAYPGRVFENTPSDVASRHYVERYLDATKSNMLFSKGVILVEGIAEQMLLPWIARFINCPLEDHHVAVVRTDGSTFKHFIKLFGSNVRDELRQFALPRRVACLLDADPQKRNKHSEKSRWESCWPFEIGLDPEVFDYKPVSSVVHNLNSGSLGPNVNIFYDSSGDGKTLEYDLAYHNPSMLVLITEACEHHADLRALMQQFADNQLSWDEEDPITQTIRRSRMTEDRKQRAYIAYQYLKACEKNKGEHAFMLRQQLETTDPRELEGFRVPPHIENAIKWAAGVN